MKDKLRMLLESYQLNFTAAHYPRTVLDPLETAAQIVETFKEQKATIDVDKTLTKAGKIEAAKKAATDALKQLTTWATPRIKGLDTDLKTQHAALLHPSTVKPDAAKLAAMVDIIKRHPPAELAILYESAEPEERLLIEHASEAVGRIPVKDASGLSWSHLLDPSMVEQNRRERAAGANPQAAQKLQELENIRAMNVTTVNHAVQAIRESVPDDVEIPAS